MSLLEIIIEKTGVREVRSSVASNYEEQMLIASLLALVAKSDGGIAPEEISRMVKLLRKRFGLRPGEALDLVSRAAEELPKHEQIDEIVDSVNESLSRAQIEDLMFMILCVIAADNQKDAGEIKLLSELMDGLKLSDRFMEKVYERYFDGLFY
ncbi:MAG: TerB family tellurite resistance protein [Woeseiaceae bacterium]|nr:TerB family tellurite resistance protein [Woeseiaceae bacterium]